MKDQEDGGNDGDDHEASEWFRFKGLGATANKASTSTGASGEDMSSETQPVNTNMSQYTMLTRTHGADERQEHEDGAERGGEHDGNERMSPGCSLGDVSGAKVTTAAQD